MRDGNLFFYPEAQVHAKLLYTYHVACDTCHRAVLVQVDYFDYSYEIRKHCACQYPSWYNDGEVVLGGYLHGFRPKHVVERIISETAMEEWARLTAELIVWNAPWRIYVDWGIAESPSLHEVCAGSIINETDDTTTQLLPIDLGRLSAQDLEFALSMGAEFTPSEEAYVRGIIKGPEGMN